MIGGSILAVSRMKVDIFPALNLPVIYVCQPYGGMDPPQMEGLIANYYEYHFLYINGIHHVESKNVQGVSLMKLYLPSRHRHGPGDGRDGRLRQSLARLHAAGHRAAVHHALRHRQRAGRLSRAVERHARRSARFRIRRCSKSGRCSPPFPACRPRRRSAATSGPSSSAPIPTGCARYNLSADDVVEALTAGQHDQPVRATSASATSMPLVPVNAMVVQTAGTRQHPVRPGSSVFLRDVGHASRTPADIPTGYALVNGKRAVYILVTKRADASTLDVVNRVKAEPCRRCRRRCPTTSTVELRVRPVAVRHRADEGRRARRRCSAPCSPA